MHYRNGREAQNGDKVVQLGVSDGQILNVGVLYDAQSGNDYCTYQSFVTKAYMCDCLHLDDVQALLKEKGLDRRDIFAPSRLCVRT